jgi:hypothetical protein
MLRSKMIKLGLKAFLYKWSFAIANGSNTNNFVNVNNNGNVNNNNANNSNGVSAGFRKRQTE